MKDFAISIQNLTIELGNKKILNEFNLDLEKNSFTSLLGPSGCGKSTLLRAISQILKPKVGQVQFQIPNPKIGFVFQDSNLIPWRTVEENLRLPFELRRKIPENTRDLINHELSRVGLENINKLYPHQLSGGMKMRVSLARALIESPEILLLDEPLAALDETTRQNLQEELRQLWSDSKMTILFVTHSISESVFLSDEVVLLRPFRNNSENQVYKKIKINLDTNRRSDLRSNSNYLNLVNQTSKNFREILI